MIPFFGFYIHRTSTAEVLTQPVQTPFGVQRNLHQCFRMGWDGVGRGIKSVLQFSLYSGGIQIMYMYTYIYSQKLSAQISCGFKMLVKLGVRMQKFKNTLQVGFFKNRTKSRPSNFTDHGRPFCEKLSIIFVRYVEF